MSEPAIGHELGEAEKHLRKALSHLVLGEQLIYRGQAFGEHSQKDMAEMDTLIRRAHKVLSTMRAIQANRAKGTGK